MRVRHSATAGGKTFGGVVGISVMGWLSVQATVSSLSDSSTRLGIRPQGLQDSGRPLQRDAVILVPLIPGNLGFMHAQFLSQLPLGQPASDPQRDQKLPQPAKIADLVKLSAFEPLVALDLFLKLLVEGHHRIQRPLDLAGAIPCLSVRPFAWPIAPSPGGCAYGFFIFLLAVNHDLPPTGLRILTIPRGLPSRRDRRRPTETQARCRARLEFPITGR